MARTKGLILTFGVESSEFQDDENLGTVCKYVPSVTYSFKLSGSERLGTDIAIEMNNLYSEWAQAEVHARRYPVGRTVAVFTMNQRAQDPTLPVASLAEFRTLLPGALAIAFLTFPDGILLARAFAAKDGYVIKPNQELVALAAANLVSGLCKDFPWGQASREL